MNDYAIILAADLPSADLVVNLAKQVGPIVDGVKVAAATLFESGSGVLGQVRNLIGDKPLLLDLKVADIGFYSNGKWDGTNAKIIRSLRNSGATHVTVHGFPGPMSIAEAVAAARESDLHVLLLPLMSHPAASLFFSAGVDTERLIEQTATAGLEVKFPENASCTDVTEAIVLLGEALDVHGYIGPGTRPEDLRRYRAMTARPIWCPGFGRQDRLGRTLKEQLTQWAQIVGPASAAIVGSAIFKAQDPAVAAAEIAQLRHLAAAGG